MKRKLTILIAFFAAVTSLYAQQDVIETNKGPLKINPVMHGSLVLEWQGKAIYIDPYGGGALFENMPSPDLILITDIHGDHLDKQTLQELKLEKATFIVPQAVKDEMGEIKASKINVLNNGKKNKWNDIEIEAVPMYNLPETADSRHPKGRGNGYILSLGGKKIYISGDTEDIKEMRQLKNIDIAFVCMNQPYTMDINQAADAVLEFQPAIVYPYHFRGGGGAFSDVDQFKEMVEAKNEEIEVRLRDWYNQE